MACFEARRVCPRGVLCRPHFDAYRDMSAKMFRVLEQYSPTLVPISIDEGFLDLTTMVSVVWRNTTSEKYVGEICETIARELKIPVAAGQGNSSRLAKLATDAAKPDYEATRLTGQLRREQLQARELSLTIRFENFSEVGGSIASSIAISKLRHQRRAGRHFPRSDVRANQTSAPDSHRILESGRLDKQPTLWGRTDAEHWGALDDAHKNPKGEMPLRAAA